MPGHVKDSATVFDLAAQLAREVGQFVDQRIELFKAELKQEVAQTVKSLGLLVGGTVGCGRGNPASDSRAGSLGGRPRRAPGPEGWPS